MNDLFATFTPVNKWGEYVINQPVKQAIIPCYSKVFYHSVLLHHISKRGKLGRSQGGGKVKQSKKLFPWGGRGEKPCCVILVKWKEIEVE